ncbi:hypothetical protein AQPE_1339 [Aquipluma nitroreducens]|uniref:Uncharacterized protein n=1 Tax=Aquipluma nitroreducens TaxID=2010828 RepID=A0A5K7S6Q9_9BACT|nr:hypothetical protein AQPE_1339 [Aquipluma nitroreducens]
MLHVVLVFNKDELTEQKVAQEKEEIQNSSFKIKKSSSIKAIDDNEIHCK